QVRKFSFALVHSTTKALPAWRSACGTKNMAVRLLPRDVRTRWNSTYDMLVVAVQYKDVVNAVTADRNLPLRKYELSDSDWMIVEDMRTMNKYYSATDMSNVYRIAMVLHPSLKLEYFKSRKWADTWIATAKDLVSEEYD
ncbi:hypothetical protein B0H13DRAFT_1582379, partial [Mycena leptocephala]